MAEDKKPKRLRRKRGETGEPGESAEALPQHPDEVKTGDDAKADSAAEPSAASGAEADPKVGSEPPAASPDKADAAAEPEAEATVDPEPAVDSEPEAEDEDDSKPKNTAEAAGKEAKIDGKEAKADDADAKADDAKADDAKADAKAKAKEASKPKRRRGAAETTTSKGPARPAPRRESDGAVQVRAQAKYVRSAPRKARLVMKHIRGKRIDDARAILRHTPRAAATDIAKLLESAVANAENNFELDLDDLKIDRAFVDEGPTIKRFRPRALGRATPIHKRTSHMTITLTTEEKS